MVKHSKKLSESLKAFKNLTYSIGLIIFEKKKHSKNLKYVLKHLILIFLSIYTVLSNKN